MRDGVLLEWGGLMLCILPYSCLFFHTECCWFNHKLYQKRTWSLCWQWWCPEGGLQGYLCCYCCSHVLASCTFLIFHQLFYLHFESNKNVVIKQFKTIYFPLGFREQWQWLQSPGKTLLAAGCKKKLSIIRYLLIISFCNKLWWIAFLASKSAACVSSLLYLQVFYRCTLNKDFFPKRLNCYSRIQAITMYLTIVIRKCKSRVATLRWVIRWLHKWTKNVQRPFQPGLIC